MPSNVADFVIPIAICMGVILLNVFPPKRKVDGWNSLVATLRRHEAVSPTWQQLRECAKRISTTEPLSYKQLEIAVQVRFRFGVKPQLAFAHLYDSIIYIRWVGDLPRPGGLSTKLFLVVFLPLKRLRLKGDTLFLEQKDELVSSVRVVEMSDQIF